VPVSVGYKMCQYELGTKKVTSIVLYEYSALNFVAIHAILHHACSVALRKSSGALPPYTFTAGCLVIIFLSSRVASGEPAIWAHSSTRTTHHHTTTYTIHTIAHIHLAKMSSHVERAHGEDLLKSLCKTFSCVCYCSAVACCAVCNCRSCKQALAATGWRKFEGFLVYCVHFLD